MKPSNHHQCLPVVIINISELDPGDVEMVKSTSCLWQGTHGAGDRQKERAASRALMSVPPPSLIAPRPGSEGPRADSPFGGGCAVIVLVKGHGQEQNVAKSRACCLWVSKSLLQNVDVVPRAASSQSLF